MAGRLTWIVILLAIAIWGIAARDLVLGLDLKGGVTMRYELEEPKDLPPNESIDDMMATTVDTLRDRIDQYGIRESSITRQGVNEIVIELPGSSKDEAETIKSVISRVGHLEFRIILRSDGSDDDPRNGVVVASEREELAELLARPENQGNLADEIDVSSLQINLEDVSLIYRWTPYSDKLIAKRRQVLLEDVEIEELIAAAPLTADDYELVRIETEASKTFTGSDVQSPYPTIDQGGGAAVGITMRPGRASEFGDWTEPNIDRNMGMVLDGRLAESPATINARLENQFIIRSGAAGFSATELKNYLTVIKSGSLQMKPRLLFENTIGPSLGESSIQAGLYAMIAGFVAILIFMIAYYRVNGVIAAICLLFNMTLLGGFLMFLGATLTLPGLAGLVLTLGMAVDANILIFERLREEADRAKSVSQAVKLGFEKALSTIIDANVTTFFTGVILYNFGSGPVRGFAVILMLGITTSVFSVLVVGRVIFDYMVAKDYHGFTNMGRFIKGTTSIRFLDKGKTALRISAVLVIVSLVAFFMADRDKYGLDFLGGYKAQVRLASGATQGEVNALVGSVFDRAQVISVGGTADVAEADTYLIKLKAGPDAELEEAEEVADLEELYEIPLKQALASVILPDFVEDITVTPIEATASTRISATVNFEQDPTMAATAAAVESHLGFLTELEVTQQGPQQVAVAGIWAREGLDAQQVVQRLRVALAEAEDLPATSEPFLESTTIGGRVGTELRDSAIRAILGSFIVIVLYIRVRFREYRYGIAAIVAVAHDVSITLGIVGLVHFTGFIDVEIDLAMIAAFLTIIGYSLNDTIVLFDRVRENLPRMTDKSYVEVLDISINQTLSRTLLTSTTTLVALGFIFAFNYGRQNVLEGFSFAMIIGVVVGTYSSIFVAAPVLTILAHRGGHATTGAGGGATASHKGAVAKQGVPS